MKTFSKSMLAVTGLALSLAACGPGIQGEGTKKTNTTRLLKIQEKAEAAELKNYPHIKAIALGVADEDEMLVKVELDNVGTDLEEKQKSADGLVLIKGEEITNVDVIKGKANTYKIKLLCLEECTMIAGILDIEANALEATAAVAEEAVKEETAKDETATEEVKEEDTDELFSAQSGTTAPEAKPIAKEEAKQSIRTGIVVSATGEVLKTKTLDSTLSIEESIDSLMADVALKRTHRLIK